MPKMIWSRQITAYHPLLPSLSKSLHTSHLLMYCANADTTVIDSVWLRSIIDSDTSTVIIFRQLKRDKSVRLISKEDLEVTGGRAKSQSPPGCLVREPLWLPGQSSESNKPI